MNIEDYKPVDSCQIPGLAGIYAGVFGLKNNGTFVEIGAYDGKTYSNTYQLAKLGWKGLYVKPYADYAQMCCNNHFESPSVKVVNKFVSVGSVSN